MVKVHVSRLVPSSSLVSLVYSPFPAFDFPREESELEHVEKVWQISEMCWIIRKNLSKLL